MTYNPSYIADLLVKTLLQNINAEEHQHLDHWLAADHRHPQLFKSLLDPARLKSRWEEHRAIDTRASWEALQVRLKSLG